MNKDLARQFELGGEELDLLFSIQRQLTEVDISTSSPETQEYKKAWLKHWVTSIEGKDAKGKDIRGPGWQARKPNLTKSEIIKRLKSLSAIKRELILFESLLFTPYFNLNIRTLSAANPYKKGTEKNSEEKRKLFDKPNKERWGNGVSDLADEVDLPKGLIQKAEQEYLDALNDIAGNPRWKRLGLILLSTAGLAVTTGIVAPFIGGLIGTLMGLSGAAATSAGLAFLGGGAIAAGGLGMAGGTAVLVGGGAVFGGLASTLFTPNFLSQPEAILTQLARLDTVLRVFMADHNKIDELLQTAMEGLASDRKKLVAENAKWESSKTPQKTESAMYAKSLTKIIDYYKVAIERLNAMILDRKLADN